MQVYECLTVDTVTQVCTNWQVMEVPQPNEAPITKDQANNLTLAIIGFMAFVFVLKQIKSFL